MLVQGTNSRRFVGIIWSDGELLSWLCKFAKGHRTLNFHDMHTSPPIVQILSPQFRTNCRRECPFLLISKLLHLSTKMLIGLLCVVNLKVEEYLEEGLEGYSEDIMSFDSLAVTLQVSLITFCAGSYEWPFSEYLHLSFWFSILPSSSSSEH